jgi:hypothetical protein
LPFVPRRRSPSKPNGACLRPASHYGKALRAFDRFARSASVFQRQRDCHSGGLNAERTDHDRQENKPAHAPRLRRAQDRTGYQLLGRDWRRLDCVQPKIAISWRSLAPRSAARVAPALRKPWAEPGQPAAPHTSRNQLPKLSFTQGWPRSLTRKVRSPVLVAEVVCERIHRRFLR